MTTTTTAPEVTDVGTPRPRPRGLARTMSFRMVGLVVCLTALVVVIGLSLAVGAKAISPEIVWQSLTHYDTNLDDHVIIRELRLPRTMLGIVVGIALGVAGALIQALTRNPLADPGILGVNAGAAFTVTVAVAVTGITSIWGYLWFAFAGALLATVAVYAIGMAGRQGATPVRLTLAGVALGAVLGGISQSITLLRPDVFDRMRHRGAGSLAGRPAETTFVVVGFIAAGLVLGLIAARGLKTRYCPGQRPGPLARHEHQPHPSPGHPRGHPAGRCGHCGRRADRLRRTDGAARGPLVRRPGPEVDRPVHRRRRPGAPAERRCDRPCGGPTGGSRCPS